LSSLGEGAFGSVNLALDKSSNRYVAVKAVNIMKTCELNKERHVLRERDLLLCLNHPNIIKMYSCFKDEHNLYFVFENAANGDLDRLIKRTQSKLSEDVVKLMFAQLVNYNEYMQKENVMHRDLKPLNIMLDKNYNMKVIDFGDARRVDE